MAGLYLMPARAFAGDRFGLGIQAGCLLDHGTSGSESSIRFDAALARELELTVKLTSRWSLAVSLLEAQPRARIESNGINVDGRLKAVPVTGEIRYQLTGMGARWKPFIAAGMVYPFFRRVDRSPFDSGGTISRIDTSDHGALSLSAGAEFSIARQWGIAGSIRYGPFHSTAEPIDSAGNTLHADFHPLALTGGVVFHF